MASLWDMAKNIGGAAADFFTGTPEVRKNVSTLRKEQEPLYKQLVGAGLGRGAGGAFGTAADYYRNLLGDESADFDAFSAPMMRQYQQDIVPGLSEQFAGMGAGGLSSSGFRNAQTQGATDLAERLGQLRASLRQSGVQGLMGIGQAGLQNFSQNMITEEGSPGFLSQLAPAVGTAIGSYAGPVGSALGKAAGNWIGNKFGGTQESNQVGANTSPYGQSGPVASPQRSQLPTFMQGTKYGRG